MTMDEHEGDEEQVAEPSAAVARLLADESLWSDPPEDLEESIVNAIRAERVAQPAPDATAPGSAAGRVGRRVHRRWWQAAAAALVAVVAAGVLVLLPDGETEDQVALGIDGTELAPGASAAAVVDELANGVAIRLEIVGLEPAPDGAYYQGWVRSEDGELVSIGTFHQRGGDGPVTLWSGVPLADYPTLTVTLQREGEGNDSSGKVVLRGSLIRE